MNTITLELITVPGGGELVLIPRERLQAAVERSKYQVAQLRKKITEKEAALKNPPKNVVKEELEAMIEEDKVAADRAEQDTAMAVEKEEQLRERFGAHITKVDYAFRPYTDGEKQDALADATSYDSGSPKLDIPKYHRILVATCCSLTADDIRGLSPARAEALTREVVDRSEPDPARLDFLFSCPPSPGKE